MKKKLNLRHILLTLASMASAFVMQEKAAAEIVPLITKENISAQDCLGDNWNDWGPKVLLDEGCDRKYHTPDEGLLTRAQYIKVDFGSEGLTLGDDEDLVLYLRRCNDCDNRQPTVFRVEGIPVGSSTPEPVCHLYFLYRGKQTREFSSRFRPEKKYSALLFYVTENNTRDYHSDNKFRSMGMSEFQLYKLKRTDSYPREMADRFHHKDDMKKSMYHDGFSFEHTMGYLDSRNRDLSKTTSNVPCVERWEDVDGGHWRINNEAIIKGEPVWQEDYIKRLNEWATWGSDWNSTTGKWNLDNDKLAEFGIQMPEMGLLTQDNDFGGSMKYEEGGKPLTVSPDNRRQPTHETEHILYAVPGDPVILYPYYLFAHAFHYEKYEVNYAHWYDYRTGARLTVEDKNGVETDLLDFHANPRAINITPKDGYFGAYLLTERDNWVPGLDAENYGMSATFLYPRDPMDEAGEVKSLKFRQIDEAVSGSDNDVSEYIIAADFSQSFNRGRNMVSHKEGDNEVVDKIIEPNIAFRHIFRIRDGKTFADEFSSSAEANEKYIQKHSRKVMARAGKPFQIGLENPVPEPYQTVSGWHSSPSNYYYKVSETDYRRVEAMRIQVSKYNAQTNNWDAVGDGAGFHFAQKFNGIGQRNLEGIDYFIADAGFNGAGSYWRLLKTDWDLQGKYKVELIGREIIGSGKEPTDIMVFGSSRPLVVMEYVIDFVNNEDDETNPQALLVAGDRLYREDKYEFAREETLIKKYGEPKDKIDFDYYRNLETLPQENKKEYLHEYTADNGNKHYRYKWPAAWEKSNYGYGYSEGHNYNMYVVANHSSQTTYHNRWHENDKHNNAENEGIYDVLYSKTVGDWSWNHAESAKNFNAENPNPAGYFLYVNAANDPGVMVTLNAGTLCTGSTINVSAWVAEFSRQTESANLVFNLVAVLKGTGDRIPVHSYVSGYLPNGDAAGVWHKVFYSFQPDVDHIGYSSSMIDHYEIELENNCTSSDGADYAIDEISIYIVSPVVAAEQEIALCMDVDVASDKNVKIYAPFAETLRSIGVSEAGNAGEAKDITLDYVILDRAKFDEEYAKLKNQGDADPGANAYAMEGVRIQGGELNFKTFYGSIPAYGTITELNTVGSYADERGNRMIGFKVNFKDENYAIGKEYYISLYAQSSSDNIAAGWQQFDITDPCSKACIFKVAGKNAIRIDGEVVPQSGPITVCEGEHPVISIDLYSEQTQKQHTAARCDWFTGTLQEYSAIKDASGLTLYKAMSYFREAFPEAESPEAEDVTVSDKGFTQAMLNLIIANKGKIVFYKNEYEFPVLTVSDDKTQGVVVALPIPYQEEDSDNTVCTAPAEVSVEVEEKTPVLLHGLDSDIEYPENLTDVPLRIGLSQISAVSIDKNNKPAEGTNVNSLVIPLRKVETSGVMDVKEVNSLTANSSLILLEATTDTNYDLDLESVESSTGESYMLKPEIVAGEIRSLNAVVGGEDNRLSAVFYDDFTFREGFEYTFSYSYAEVVPESVTEKHKCEGSNLFTIKVVPEYLVWDGDAESRNWNNDDNWRRAESKEIYADLNDEAVSGRLDKFVTDGSNTSSLPMHLPISPRLSSRQMRAKPPLSPISMARLPQRSPDLMTFQQA